MPIFLLFVFNMSNSLTAVLCTFQVFQICHVLLTCQVLQTCPVLRTFWLSEIDRFSGLHLFIQIFIDNIHEQVGWGKFKNVKENTLRYFCVLLDISRYFWDFKSTFVNFCVFLILFSNVLVLQVTTGY